MMTLEEFLEHHIRFVEEATKDLPNGGDLEPFLAYLKPDNEVVYAQLSAGFDDGASKDLTMAWCRTRMQRDQAQIYALVSAAWVVVRATDSAQADEVMRVVAQEGTGGRYKDERREVYMISAGDRDRTIIAMLDVKRDYKGKIRQLTRNPLADQGTFEGRMANLLRTIQ
jgi:hypothetical protein